MSILQDRANENAKAALEQYNKTSNLTEEEVELINANIGKYLSTWITKTFETDEFEVIAEVYAALVAICASYGYVLVPLAKQAEVSAEKLIEACTEEDEATKP